MPAHPKAASRRVSPRQKRADRLQTPLLTDVALYDRDGIDWPGRDPEIHPLNLPDAEKVDLVAFLKALNSVPKPFVVPALPR